MAIRSIETTKQEYLTTKSAMAFLGGVSRDFLDRLREEGLLPYRKVKGIVFFRVSDIVRLIETHKVY